MNLNALLTGHAPSKTFATQAGQNPSIPALQKAILLGKNHGSNVSLIRKARAGLANNIRMSGTAQTAMQQIDIGSTMTTVHKMSNKYRKDLTSLLPETSFCPVSLLSPILANAEVAMCK
jgi:hypothetical protein